METSSCVATLRGPCITLFVSTETWFNFSFQNRSIGTKRTGVYITTLPQEALPLYHCGCPWWSRRLSGTSKSGTRDRSQLVLLRRARSIYTGTSHLALLHYQRCHFLLCHPDTGLLRLLCYRIHRERVCCNYDLPVERNRCRRLEFVRFVHAFSFVFGVKFLLFLWPFAPVMLICILYNFVWRVIYLVSSEFKFCKRLLDLLQLFSSSLVRHIRLVSPEFLRLFRFAIFLHSLCSVVVSYFIFIPVFA